MNDSFERNVKSRLEQLEGSYGVSTNIDYEDDAAIISITYEDESDRPNLAEPIKLIQGALEPGKNVKGDWNPGENTYNVFIEGLDDEGRSRRGCSTFPGP